MAILFDAIVSMVSVGMRMVVVEVVIDAVGVAVLLLSAVRVVVVIASVVCMVAVVVVAVVGC